MLKVWHDFSIYSFVTQKEKTMIKSNIAQGQMFIQFPQPIAELQDTPKPRVWVKIRNEELNGEEVSLFIDNEVLMLIAMGAHDVKEKGVSIRDKWFITDTYYGKCVREGKFVPIDDLRQVESICLELGYEMPESRCPF